VLSGKRRLTLKSARLISERLAFAPDETASFLKATQRKAPEREDAELGPRQRLDAERFRLIADWYHFAILSLTELPRCESSPEWIADKLGISRREAETALRRLRDLGLVAVQRGRLKQVSPPLVSTNDVPSAALRKHNRQMLQRGLDALETVPVEWRDIGTMTMALDPRKLPQAKRLIRRFRQQIAELCESGDPILVYHFSTLLFPVNAPEKFCDPKEYEDAIRARD
jgi:uncharacterized protein (TIGR02147 family)